MNRVYNFSAGPSMLPESVLLRAAAEMLDYEGSGQSVMEMSHRSKVYDTIIKGAESLLREVMEIPDNYKVLFLQGGASSQFAMVPLNLMTKNRKADYVLSGQFSTKAYKARDLATAKWWHPRKSRISAAFPTLTRRSSARTRTTSISA